MLGVVCKHCGYDYQTVAKKGPHTGLYCGRCGKWIKWATPAEVAEIERMEKELNEAPDLSCGSLKPDMMDDDCDIEGFPLPWGL